MEPISPNTGAPEVVLAEHQPQYVALPAAIYDLGEPIDRYYLTRWKLSDQDVRRLAAGEDLFIAQLVPAHAHFAPLKVEVGMNDQWDTRAFGRPVGVDGEERLIGLEPPQEARKAE